jgi:hypothetical protein
MAKPCAATNKNGSPCKRSAAEGSAICHLHARQRNARAADVLRFPLAEGVARYQFDRAELGAWLRQVRLGEVVITQQKVLGGSGELVEVEISPDFADRLSAAALEHRVASGITHDAGISGEDLADQLRRALKTM